MIFFKLNLKEGVNWYTYKGLGFKLIYLYQNLEFILIQLLVEFKLIATISLWFKLIQFSKFLMVAKMFL